MGRISFKRGYDCAQHQPPACGRDNFAFVPGSRPRDQRINTCFVESLAPLRLNQLEQGIAHCDQLIEDKTTPSVQRGEAFAQRGLMYARRWSVVSTTAFAVQGVADITEAFRLHTPAIARKHQLLIVRAQLNAALGQTRRASEDFTAVFNEDAGNAEAQRGLRQLGFTSGPLRIASLPCRNDLSRRNDMNWTTLLQPSRILAAILIVFLSGTGPLSAQKLIYLEGKKLNLLQILPPPPEPGSEGEQKDIAEVLEVQENRTPAEAEAWHCG